MKFCRKGTWILHQGKLDLALCIDDGKCIAYVLLVGIILHLLVMEKRGALQVLLTVMYGEPCWIELKDYILQHPFVLLLL